MISDASHQALDSLRLGPQEDFIDAHVTSPSEK